VKLDAFRRFTDLFFAGAWRGDSAMRTLHETVGIAPTPRRVVHDERAFELYHFAPPAGAPALPDTPPVLIVPSLINRWYILDLMPDHSTVAALAAQGLNVYVMAWRGANDGMGPLRLPAYVDGFIHRAVQLVCGHARAPKISLVGQCLGGTLAVAYAATHPERVDRLVALTTPVDFSHGGLLGTWAHRDLVDVDAIVRTHPGVLPDRVVYGAFPLLNPRALVTKHRVLYQMVEAGNDEYVRLYQALDLWTSEHLPVGSGAFASLLQDLYQDNRLVEGTWMFETGPARLSNIRCPVLSLAAKRDEIVPLESARALLGRTSSVRPVEHVSPVGHVTLVVGTPLRFQTWKVLGDFCR